MYIEKDELTKLITDPNKVQTYILESIENATKGNKVITEPTNPFMMLLEMATVSAGNSIEESINVTKQLYPNLATEKSELYHHLSDNELANTFSIPADVPLVIYINATDLKISGHRPDNAEYVETTIPIGTEINVNSLTFTILNKINIKLYDNGKVFVEQQLNDNDISVSSLGVLPSGIVSFQDNEAWIVFETIVRQIKKHTIYKTITPAEGFYISTIINNLYYYSDVSYRNDTTNGEYIKLNKSHNEAYINPKVPTVYIELIDNNVNFKIPDIYLLNQNINGDFKIELYETQGYIYLPLYKFSMDDFTINISKTGTTDAEATISNIHILANSRATLEGGKSATSIDDLRDSIIFNSTGDIDVPVTDINIITKGAQYDFDIRKMLDIVTDRIYVAYKNIPKLENNLIYCKPDIMFNTLSIIVNEIPVTNNVIKTDDYIIIKSNTLFKNVNNLIELVSDIEKEEISNQDNPTLVNTLNTTDYFVNPYYYIVNINTEDITSKIYDLDNPEVKDIKIVGKNINLIERVNTDRYGIYKNDNGYELIITLVHNDEFLNSNLNSVKAQLTIPLANSDEVIYFNSDYDKDNNLFRFSIDTDFYLSDDKKLLLTNGTSSIHNTYIDLNNEVSIHIYSLDTDLLDESGYLTSEIMFDLDTNKVVFNKETFTMYIGEELTYLWNMLYNTFTDRKYLTHQYDVPMYYEEDVYDVDPDTGSIFRCVTDDNGNEVPEYTILHSKGDPVLDNDGNQVYKYRKGDIVLNEFSLPTIDQQSGVVRHIDILMLEYQFYKANSEAYINYLDIIKKTLNKWLNTDMVMLNNNMLENTKIYYKSNKKLATVKVLSNNKTFNIPFSVKPSVVLYVKDNNYNINEINNIKTVIGTIIHSTIENKDINLNTAKDTIITSLGNNVLGVKITNIEPVENSEIFSLVNGSTGLTVSKTLDITPNNEIVVIYDLDLKIVGI